MIMLEFENHPWAHRFHTVEEMEVNDFEGAWMQDLEMADLAKPALGIINGWMAEHMENKWYADRLAPDVSVYAYDSRGQGNSIKTGRMDAVQGAIDANFVLGTAFSQFDSMAEQRDVVPGTKFLQGNCIGTMVIAAMFAGKFPLVKDIRGTILISPVSTFDLPWFAKAAYFLPKWAGSLVVNYFAEPLAKLMVGGEESETSRRTALDRVYRMDLDAALQQAKDIFWRENVGKFWSSIDVPSLLLVSRNDPLTTIDESAEVYNRLRYPIWVELEAPDHLLLEDNIDFVSKLIVKFTQDPWVVYDRYIEKTP